jgi:hypothetical protein
MTTLREAAQQALEALECIEYGICGIDYGPSDDTTESAIAALKAALAQEEPWTPAKLGDALVQWVDASALAQEEQTTRAQQMRDAGYTRRPTLREMAQQEQEPVAWMLPRTDSIITAATKVYRGVLAEDYAHPLYTHPPRREWRSLSEGEVASCWAKGFEACKDQTVGDLRMHIARAVEAALKEKNQ